MSKHDLVLKAIVGPDKRGETGDHCDKSEKVILCIFTDSVFSLNVTEIYSTRHGVQLDKN